MDIDSSIENLLALATSHAETLILVLGGLAALFLLLALQRVVSVHRRKTQGTQADRALANAIAKSSKDNDIALEPMTMDEAVPDNEELDITIPRMGENIAQTQEPTANATLAIDAPKASVLAAKDKVDQTGEDDELKSLAEIERKMLALKELHQNGLIASEIYVLKAREYAADGQKKRRAR